MNDRSKSLHRADMHGPRIQCTPFAARLLESGPEGELVVELTGGGSLVCAWLQVSAVPVFFTAGDTVLVVPIPGSDRPVVVGRIASGSEQASAPDLLCIAAERKLSLRCGASSIELRADGKVLIKGDDVTVRANGTQRIRAGTVSIN